MSLLGDLFSQNLLLRWLSGRWGTHDLEVSMAGVKLGERVVQVGCARPWLLAALAAKVGLTGRAYGLDARESDAARAQQVADRAGVLVETRAAPYATPPWDRGSVDVAVVCTGGSIDGASAVDAAVAGAGRLLRPGGRCLVVAPGAHPGGAADIVRRLEAAGFRGGHLLASRAGLIFVEAMNPRPTTNP